MDETEPQRGANGRWRFDHVIWVDMRARHVFGAYLRGDLIVVIIIQVGVRGGPVGTADHLQLQAGPPSQPIGREQ